MLCPYKQELYFFEKKCFFRKKLKKQIHKFFMENFLKFFEKIFRKNIFQKKHFFSVFFQKNKDLVYRSKTIFSPKKVFFVKN